MPIYPFSWKMQCKYQHNSKIFTIWLVYLLPVYSVSFCWIVLLLHTNTNGTNTKLLCLTLSANIQYINTNTPQRDKNVNQCQKLYNHYLKLFDFMLQTLPLFGLSYHDVHLIHNGRNYCLNEHYLMNMFYGCVQMVPEDILNSWNGRLFVGRDEDIILIARRYAWGKELIDLPILK